MSEQSSIPAGWAMPEYHAIAIRPAILGMPLGFAALLIVVCLQLVLTFGLVGAGAFVFVAGWRLGVMLTGWDAFYWEIGMASMKQPKALVP